jgi:hypothetical protein
MTTKKLYQRLEAKQVVDRHLAATATRGGPFETERPFEADAGTRTPDPFITSEVLYQLSYVGILALQRGYSTLNHSTARPHEHLRSSENGNARC